MDELEALRSLNTRLAKPSDDSIQRIRQRFESTLRSELIPTQRSRRSWVRRSAVGIVAAIVLVSGISSYVLATANGNTKEPSAGSWRLASYLSGLTWQENTQGLIPGELACPTSTICYMAASAGANSSLYITADGGGKWSSVPFPAGVTPTTALQCPGMSTCFVGAKTVEADKGGNSVLLETNDGGLSWAQRPLPIGVGTLYDLSCASSESCAGLASLNDVTHAGSSFIESADAGGSWAQHGFPASQIEDSLGCATVLFCVVAGNTPALVGGVPGAGDAWLTADGGQTWQAGLLPSNIANVGTVACPTMATCWAISAVIGPDPNCSSSTTVVPGIPSPCSPSKTTLTTEPIVSSDGGLTWAVASIPTISQATLFALSCPTATTCWIVGSDGLPNNSTIPKGDAPTGGTPLVLLSTDGGTSWSPQSLPAPGNVGEIPSAIDQIQCATATTCVALGLSGIGSQHTIVYSYGSGSPESPTD
jgi:photosystem II stability/assembly factor-like uncharacterized protein